VSVRTIELQWDDGKWGRSVAERIVREILDGLEANKTTLPDKFVVRGPLIARDYDPDPSAQEFEPMVVRLTSLLTGERSIR
jgi:hypothetical protein